MNPPRFIDAGHLELAYQCQRAQALGVIGMSTRYAAMSNGLAHVRRCDTHGCQSTTSWRLPPLFVPMDRGNLTAVIDRVRVADGRDGVRKVFGVGIRALLAEVSGYILNVPQKGQP